MSKLDVITWMRDQTWTLGTTYRGCLQPSLQNIIIIIIVGIMA